MYIYTRHVSLYVNILCTHIYIYDICVCTYVVGACANVYSMYMYVYMRVSMYPSPVDEVGGREHETSDHICTLYGILLYNMYIIFFIGLYTFRYPRRCFSHSTYFISDLPSPYLTIFLRPSSFGVGCGQGSSTERSPRLKRVFFPEKRVMQLDAGWAVISWFINHYNHHYPLVN